MVLQNDDILKWLRGILNVYAKSYEKLNKKTD